MADGVLNGESQWHDDEYRPTVMRRIVRASCRFFYRVLLFYWICFFFPFPLDLIGLPISLVDNVMELAGQTESKPAWLKTAEEYFNKPFLWQHNKSTDVCKWVGEHVLHVDVIIQLTGSGDTMHAYVGCFCAGVIALGLALIWSVVAPLLRRINHSWCPDDWLGSVVRVLVRFFLFQMLLSYGFAKIFPLQFAPPSAYRLTQQLGDMSPMGLLWTFMGFSTAYQIFTGAVEVLAGLLLVTRRTTLLGALLSMLAMGQVFVLNMCFDVPVKLYSLHYLIMSIYLIFPDLGRLMNLFVLGRAVPAKSFPPMLGSKALNWVALVVRTLVVVGLIASQIQFGYKNWKSVYGGPPTPVTGRWDVVAMQIDKKPVEKSDERAWTWLDFSSRAITRAGKPTPPNFVYRTTWNADEKKLTLTRVNPTGPPIVLSFDLPQPDKLELTGTMDEKPVAVTLKPAPEKKSELMNRGFHWVQELPYNR